MRSLLGCTTARCSMLLYLPLLRISSMSPTLTMNAPSRASTENHLPSLLICRPGTSFTWSSSVRPAASVCGDKPKTLLACWHGG
uniref:Secreted protein n=1 Tax=Arundo donax TaxID=35708 RepID=A0A0A9BIL9_ARUDO